MSDTPRRMPRPDPLRTFQLLLLVLWEATLVFLVGSILTGIGDEAILRWWIILAVVLASSFTTARLEPVNADVFHVRPLTGSIVAVVIGGSVMWHIRATGGDISLRTLVNPGDPSFAVGYIALIASIVAWLRGAQLLDVGHSDVMQQFRRGVVALMLALGVATLAGFGQGLTPQVSTTSANVPALVVLWLALGLLCLSATRITTIQGNGGRSSQWLWLRSSALSTLAILLGGLVALSLVAAPAGAVLREAARWVVYVFGLVFAPVGWLILSLLILLRDTFMSNPNAALPPPMATATPDEMEPLTALPVSDALLAIPILLLLLLPVVVLVLLIIFAQRRRSIPAAAPDEQRESIFSWKTLGGDIAHLLGSLRRPREGQDGLRAVLGRLVGADPATRIRRRYVQALLQGEAALRQRRADETPREFAPALGSVVGNRVAVDTLTEAYEQARYAPASVEEATAERADRAWQMLNEERRSG